MIDAYASFPHYFWHIAPIWNALPEQIRGTFYVSTQVAATADRWGVKVHQGRPPARPIPIIVAAHSDYRATPTRPVVFVEHGSGQTYIDRPNSPAYSGGAMRDRTILFICPNDTVASRNEARYPSIPTATVGCPPLDSFHPPTRRSLSTPPTIAFTFHADFSISPETRSAFRLFHSAILLTRRAGYGVFGHAHPRLYRRIAPFYARQRIPHTDDPFEVLRRANCLVVDNSSLGFEAASAGIPIVWLSPPFYRRDVYQWPRFWDALILGPEAVAPDDVLDKIAEALTPVSPSVQQSRDIFLSTVYSGRDGKASFRAAEAILSVL